jgi:hypothetical protein
MKKILFVILILFFININLFAQISENEKLLSGIDFEYTQLLNELFEIVKNEFHPPISKKMVFIYDNNYGYGHHIQPITGEIFFLNGSYLRCDKKAPIYSMTSGIVKDIILNRMIIIEYKGIEIFYRDLDINNLNIGENIIAGQLLGTKKEADALHNYFNGIIIKIKYKTFYYDLGYMFKIIQNKK